MAAANSAKVSASINKSIMVRSFGDSPATTIIVALKGMELRWINRDPSVSPAREVAPSA